MARETLLLVDGHNLVYRAFHAMPALSNSRGEMTNAAFGFTSMLFKALNDHRPTYAIAAFDPPGPTFRHSEFAEYKATRTAPPPELRPQFGWAREVINVLGIPLVEVPQFEADDVIGTLSRKAEAAGLDVVIVTGDIDVLQLVTPHVVVFASRRGLTDTIVYDLDKVRERFGFEPPLVVDYKALQGDPSDNIPGVPGIGEKTALSLVREYGPLENILDAVPSMKPGRVRRALEEHADQARLSKRTATIRADMDITLELEPARLYHYDEREVRELFDRLEFRSLLTRLPGREEGNGHAPPPPGGQGSLSFERADAVAPDVEVEVIRDAHQAAAAVEALRRAGGISVRTIVEGAARRHDLVGVALAARGVRDRAYYLPLGHTGDDGAAEPAAVSAIAALLADPALPKTGYDLKRELLAWHGRGVNVVGLHADVMLSAYLVNTRLRVPAVSVLAQDLCGLRIEAEETLLGSGRNKTTLSAVPVDAAAQYYGAWVAALEPVLQEIDKQIDEQKVRPLLDTIEMPLIPILAAMELRGVLVDCDLLQAISTELHQRITAIEQELQDKAGYTFNPGSTQQLARFLYDDLGLAAGRRTKTGRSTDADTLEVLRDEHPIVGLILEWRQLTKLKSTYVDALPLLCGADSRIHTSFNQAVATTGRLSSSDPNLQNIPVRTEWGQRIRRAFHADPGFRLISADYSQVELRVLAHETREPELIEAFKRGEDIHRRTAAEVYNVAPEAVTPDMRRIAKVVNFGVVYGLSEFGLARDTGMTQEEARAFIEAYFANFAQVTRYLEGVRNHAREWGWVQTFEGRRRYLPDIRAANRQIRQGAERMAVNMPIQGGAADIMKRAMILVDSSLRENQLASRLLLQVHDELLLEAPVDEMDTVIPVLRSAMAAAAELVVPLDVDVKVGDNWGEMTLVARASTEPVA
ncbi:MAG TPA: DNA polymerase I [Candidatus Dormibacteraeota bacterium]|nr:DNA polymerase I [Candidatus Dormibacteraeota bacterium]